MERFYIVVRADLDPGDQLAQSAHASTTFACAHASIARAWQAGDNNLIVLSVPDEGALDRLRIAISETSPRRVAVHEPDLGYQLTAIAFEGTDAAIRLVSSLPLALRKPKKVAAA